jgi:hypothetical protein
MRWEQKAAKPTKGKKTGKKPTVKYTIDCYQPVDDKVLDPASFEKFLHDRIKVRPGRGDGVGGDDRGSGEVRG